MKKLSVIGLALVAVTACNGNKANQAAGSGTAQPAQPQAVPAPAAPAAPAAAAPAAAAPAAPEAAPAAPAAAPEAAPAAPEAAKAPEAPAGAVAAVPTAPAAPVAAPEARPTPVVAPGASANVIEAPSRGPVDAKITIVEVSDFQCPFCSRGKNTVDEVLTAYGDKVRLIFKHNPLSFHNRAMPAALASMAAAKQGKFWEMYDKQFGNQKALEDADLEKYATEIGLDMAKFKADIADPALRLQIENDQKAAVALGQGGTPAFFINGKVLSGAQPLDEFKKVIDAELIEVDKAIAAGKAAADIHKARAEANLAGQFGMYWTSLIEGKAAPKPRRPVDPTIWKAELTGKEPVKGPADAGVTVVMFSDFQCPFCSRVEPTLKQLAEKYPNDVRIVWKNNALPFHNRALPAAIASLAANNQGKFWEMHGKMFENQRALEDADLEKYATEIGLDMAKFKTDLADATLKAAVEADMELATKVNARGTPNFFVNGRNLRGAVPFEDFDALVEEELAKAKKLVADGTAAGEVYAKVIADGKTFEPLEATVNNFTAEGRPMVGNPAGDITIVEYSDFQCPFCSRIAPTMKEIQNDEELKTRVKVVFKQFPLSFHQQATPAALAALAAHEQGKFWEMHDKLFANQKDLSDENYKKWAGEIGLDMAKFDAAYSSKSGQAILDQDMAEARTAGLRGTPSIYINGRKFEAMGGYSAAAFKQVINKYFPKQ